MIWIGVILVSIVTSLLVVVTLHWWTTERQWGQSWLDTLGDFLGL